MKKRILFVDDDPVLVRVYSMVLSDAARDWEVRSATSGKQALEILGTMPMDVLVTDLRMPVMTGIELMAEVRKLHPRTSRVILSGIRDQEEVARCLADTHQFLSKPVDLNT
ncbi:MAG TPA: response regulator, partial [Verrucomicrobiae bacterium]|nr:response regulator [Verrucomicrobiae bacterium]